MKIPTVLKICISGLRGQNPGSLTPEVAYAFACAFTNISPDGPIIVSRDSRPSGHELKKAVIQALHDTGRTILDADLIPLPTTQVAVEDFKAAGAIDITASHNPAEWNGLKFLGSDGMFIRQTILDRLIETVDAIKPNELSQDSISVTDIHNESVKNHIQKLKTFALKGKKLTVAVDAVNGAGSEIIPALLQELGCDVLCIATDPSQPFPHTPEPTPKNLTWTQDQLKGQLFDLCVVVDPDADRLVLIDETGVILNEEATLPLIARELIASGRTGPIVVNLSTSQMIEDIAKPAHCPVVRSKVGEINVIDMMRDQKAFLGGEGAGAGIDPKIHYGRDSLVGITYVINLLRRTNQTLSQLADELPKYAMKKDKVEISPSIDLETIYSQIITAYPDMTINKDDGLRLSADRSWLHIRPSNTEPIIRIIAEAPTEEEVTELILRSQNIIKNI
jgi:phosphomannomutase